MHRFLWLAPALLLFAVPTSAATPAPVVAPRTAAVPSVTVVAAGDIACAPGATVTATTCRQASTARLAASLKPNRVIALGDLQYPNGSYSDFLNSYAKSWGALKSITMPVAGNHEYQTPGAAGYYRYFKDRSPGAKGYYRRVINGWQIFVLNSNCDKISCADQRTWLASAMAANPSKCSLIASHHPRFSSGGEHGSSTFMKPFWQIAARYGVDVALSGHDHDYERFALLNPSGQRSSTGIRQFVSGAGGRSHYAKGTTVPGSEKFLSTPFGVLKLTLRPAGYSWQFVGTNGRVLDSGTSACH
ncbi:MAG: metallophosphoesterase [Propionibacteriales bacterium]|nr:metallophosphoesterase [Propionibacteriales bacterium]